MVAVCQCVDCGETVSAPLTESSALIRCAPCDERARRVTSRLSEEYREAMNGINAVPLEHLRFRRHPHGVREHVAFALVAFGMVGAVLGGHEGAFWARYPLVLLPAGAAVLVSPRPRWIPAIVAIWALLAGLSFEIAMSVLSITGLTELRLVVACALGILLPEVLHNAFVSAVGNNEDELKYPEWVYRHVLRFHERPYETIRVEPAEAGFARRATVAGLFSFDDGDHTMRLSDEILAASD